MGPKPIPTSSILRALAVVFAVLAAIGGIRNYSPVPLTDMWDGYLDFFVKAKTGDSSVWWAQHNEHRIVLARMFFWIDLAWLKGTGWFLLVVNYALVAGSCGLFYAMLKERLKGEAHAPALSAASALTVIVLFSWTQAENLAMGFQSQFILAQLLPLGALYLLHKSASPTAGTGMFAAACGTGIASLGTMANGVMALPMMTLLALRLRLPWRRTSLLAGLSVLGLAGYFYDYHAPGGHGSLLNAVLHDPVLLARYVTLYLGGPFFYMTGKGSLLMAQLGGLFLIVSAAAFAYRLWQQPGPASLSSHASLSWALLAFLVYIGGSALGTGGGRLIFGLGQAITSRYQTPALMAWLALLVLYAPAISRRFGNNFQRVWWPPLLLSLLLLPQQLKALRSQQSAHFEQKVAALALELGIKDQAQIAAIFPSAEWALDLARVPAEQNLSIFGHPEIRDVRRQLGQQANTVPATPCQGALEGVLAIDEDRRYARIQGWLYDPEAPRQPQAIHILDAGGLIVGYALTSPPRFKGYLDLQHLRSQSLVLQGLEPRCTLEVAVPALRDSSAF